jgi:rod shape-determining protein MreC
LEYSIFNINTIPPVRNIFLFISRYLNFLLFVILQVICITLIVQYSKYHQAIFGSTANQITGNINSRFDRVEYYFQLKKTNDSLVKANERLYNLLSNNFNLPDTNNRQRIDSIRLDSIEAFRQFTYLSGKVVSNAVNTQNNFLVLSGPQVAQMRIGMGVVDQANAAVGVISDVSEGYAVVMSLLHKDSKINGKILKTGETGTVTWDGKYPNLLTLNDIPKSTKLAKGDTIITSGFSTFFPRGLLLGRVEAIYPDKSTNNVKVAIRTAANFYNIEFGYAIQNVQQTGIRKLLEKAKASSN